jgi:hypothetical protein
MLIWLRRMIQRISHVDLASDERLYFSIGQTFPQIGHAWGYASADMTKGRMTHSLTGLC